MSDDVQNAIRKALGRASGVEKLFGRMELKALPRLLEEGELPESIIQGRFGGQGILVATDRRLLFLDKGLLSLRTAEFRYDTITSVEYGTGLVYGHITITVAGNASKIDQVIKDRLPTFVQLVRSKIESAKTSGPAAARPADPVEQLERLARLKDAGHITAEEFEAQKARLLG